MLDSVSNAQRIVIKLGTHVVTHAGGEFALSRVHGLVEGMVELHRQGKSVVLVSSGAVGLGAQALGLDARPRGLGLRQACAAAGQGRLISLYERAFSMFDIPVAQVLLTQRDLGDPERALCVRTTLLRLLEHKAIPILNENDSVSVRELIDHRIAREDQPDAAFGDNDELSARLAVAIDADLLVLLTNVDGLFTQNPATDRNAQRIALLERIEDEHLQASSGHSSGGTGGMRGKLEAASVARNSGLDVWVADGTAPGILARLARGEDVGTRIPAAHRRSQRRRSIAVSGDIQGKLVVNDGAVRALRESKASLLPVGVVAVEGNFGRGELVEICDEHGRAIGRGQVNYASGQVEQILGHRSDAIIQRLGWIGYDAVVNRQNMALVELATRSPPPSLTPASSDEHEDPT